MKESGENYLETILILSASGPVRAVDVANTLGFSRPSVSRALGILSDSGLITQDRAGIRLTAAGRLAAENIYERHRVITSFLSLTAGVDAATAERDACRIEHILSDETFAGIKRFLDKSR